MAELQDPEVDQEQEALPPGKPPKQSGTMSTPMLLIIMGVMLAVIIVGVFLGMNYMITSVLDKKMSEAGLDTTSTMNKLQEENELYYKKIQEKMALQEMMSQLEQEDFYMPNEGIMYAELPQLIAMPKGETDKILISIGFEYRVRTEEKGEGEEEEEESAEAKDPEALFKQKPQLKAKVQSEITGVIGSMTLDEIQAVRTELEGVLTERIKPIFKKEKIWLKKVYVMQFNIM